MRSFAGALAISVVFATSTFFLTACRMNWSEYLDSGTLPNTDNNVGGDTDGIEDGDDVGSVGGAGIVRTLLPSTVMGNTAAVVSGLNNEELILYGEHDGDGHIHDLQGFEYVDASGGSIRIAFGSMNRAVTIQEEPGRSRALQT